MNEGLPMAENRWLEPLFAILIMGGMVYSFYFLSTDGYLPQPFFYDPGDTYMDWINTSMWAHNAGVYDVWGTIYPPAAFVFLRIFGIARCYIEVEGGASRECDWLGKFTLHAFFYANAILVARSFWKIDRNTAIPRAIVLGFGLPSVYGLDRGNLVIVAFTLFILAYGPLVRSTRLRWLAVGLAINLKVYLIASIFPHLIKRKWRWFEGALISTILIYVLTFGILGMGVPRAIYDNIKDFTGIYQAINFLDLWYGGTYIPFLSLLNGPEFPITFVIGSDYLEYGKLGFTLSLQIVQVTVLVASLAAYVRPESVPLFRLTNLATAFALITSEAGGYTQVMIIYLTMMERWKGIGRRWAIFACYLLCTPGDIIIYRLDPLIRDSYLAGRPVILEYAVSWGFLFRPALIMSIPFALACVTLNDVWGDIRTQGWKGRYRFRFDKPFFANGGRAVPERN